MSFSKFLGILCFLTVSNGQTILESVRQDSQLQTFANLIHGTGAGLPNPDIEERFEAIKPGRSLTLLAPTNQAFEHISKPVLAQLALPQNYPLLLSLIRNHLIEHNVNDAVFSQTNGNQTITSIEGSTLSLHSPKDGDAFVNNGYYRSFISPKATKVSGGHVYKISRLIDPYGTTYGVSTPIGKPTLLDTSPPQLNKTMSDLVLAEPFLSTWLGIMTDVLPAILKRLGDRRGPEGKLCQTPHPFAMFPKNSAFDKLPANYTKLLRAPFNFALSSHLLAWGITVPTCASFDDIMSEIKRRGKFEIFSHRADINLTITESSKGSGELMVNNARVVMANKCAGNGCIWVIDTFLDPVFGIF